MLFDDEKIVKKILEFHIVTVNITPKNADKRVTQNLYFGYVDLFSFFGFICVLYRSGFYIRQMFTFFLLSLDVAF